MMTTTWVYGGTDPGRLAVRRRRDDRGGGLSPRKDYPLDARAFERRVYEPALHKVGFKARVGTLFAIRLQAAAPWSA